MSIVYCYYCDEHIDTDYNTEHFCSECNGCLEELGSSEYEYLCPNCYKLRSEILQTDVEYINWRKG